MEIVKLTLLFIAGVLILYIVIRLLFKAMFKSFFDALDEHINHKKNQTRKENDNASI